MSGFNKLVNLDSIVPIGTKKGRVSEKLLHPQRFLIVPTGTNIATEAAAILKTTYTTGLLQESGRWYLSPYIVEGAETTSDAETKTFSSGAMRMLNDGKYSMDFQFDVENAVLNNLFSLNNKDVDIYIIWGDNIIMGCTDENGVIFYPLSVEDFHISRRTLPFNDITVVKGSVIFSDKDQLELYNKILKPTAFQFSTLESVRQVNVTAKAVGTNYDVTVTVEDESGHGVENLTEALFTVTGGTTSLFTETGGGVYNFRMTDVTASTYTLVAAASIYAVIDYEFIESSEASDSVTPATA